MYKINSSKIAISIVVPRKSGVTPARTPLRSVFLVDFRLISEKYNIEIKVLTLEHGALGSGVPTAYTLPALWILWRDPKPVIASVTGAESAVGENRIGMLFL